MKFLLDANVISEPVSDAPMPQVMKWLKWNEAESVTCSVVVAELDYGIQLLPLGRRRARLESWLTDLLGCLGVLPFDVEEAQEWSRLMAKLTLTGKPMPTKDAMIAATAIVHGLTVVTRNVRDFARTGVPWGNPFEKDAPREDPS